MKKLTLFLPILFHFILAYCQTTTINVMTFNIRLDVTSDYSNSWEHRKNRVVNTILTNNIDILGLQEVLYNQLLDLEKELPNFTWIGVGRKDGINDGEFSPIFYNLNKFTELGSGYFWLSETPFMAGSRGWDAACERIATWAKLKDNSSGKILFVLNTHFDHVGKSARIESAKLILEKLKTYTQKKAYPIILMGDFNFDKMTESYRILTSNFNDIALYDSHTLSPLNKGPDWTFHAFNNLPINKRKTIDFVFVNNKVKVLSYNVIDTSIDNTSDHNAVVVQVSM